MYAGGWKFVFVCMHVCVCVCDSEDAFVIAAENMLLLVFFSGGHEMLQDVCVSSRPPSTA